MRSNETSIPAGSINSWQEEGRTGRTFGSVGRAMRSIVESESERSASKVRDVVCDEPLNKAGVVCVRSNGELGRASPAQAMRLLFGASAT